MVGPGRCTGTCPARRVIFWTKDALVSDLKIDTCELQETGSALRILAGELRDAQHLVTNARCSIGHGRLSSRLDDMQGSWDDRRNDLRDAIEELAGVVKDAAKSFEGVEENLHAALTGG